MGSLQVSPYSQQAHVNVLTAIKTVYRYIHYMNSTMAATCTLTNHASSHDQIKESSRADTSSGVLMFPGAGRFLGSHTILNLSAKVVSLSGVQRR